jgi:NADPH-dependent 2,4-dienoyl-CoA reductase/sulfur reductase-like enzyme
MTRAGGARQDHHFDGEDAMFGEVGTVLDSASLAGAIQCDLAVVGAGVAGLNALYAAAQYLPKSARVLLIDQKDGPAGMWNCL